VDLNTRTAQHMNIAEEIARKVEMNYVFGHELQELVQRSSEDSFREIGKPSTPTFNPIEADALAYYALPFILQRRYLATHLLSISVSDARGPQTPSERPPKYAPAVLR